MSGFGVTGFGLLMFFVISVESLGLSFSLEQNEEV